MNASTRLRCRVVFLVALAAGLLTVFPTAGLAADESLVENVSLPGGVKGITAALRLEPEIDRARTVAELARLIYGVAEGVNSTTDAQLRSLDTYLKTIGTFQTSLAALDAGTRGITLAGAADKKERKRLEDFLELIGLRLREKNRTFLVERRSDKDAAARVQLLTSTGVDLADVASRLNKGDVVKLQVPADIVPVPLSKAVWQEVIFKRPVPDLVSAILADRRASLLVHGLAALDDDTLRFLSRDPKLLTWLYEDHAATFAAFASSLRVHDGAVAIAGGASALPLWEAVFGEPVKPAEPFVRELFGKDSGQLAYLFDLIANLDAPRRAFALGEWIADARERTDRFRRLADASVAASDKWEIEKRPFERPPYDTAAVLTAIRVEGNGRPAAPGSQRFWDRAFDGVDLPDDPSRDLRDTDGALIDAAWIVGRILDGPSVPGRKLRFDLFTFGQRAFASAGAPGLPHVLVAVRAIPRFQMLMLTLERMGITDPSIYDAAARAARAVGELGKDRRFSALSQFQGALSLVDRLVRSRGVTQAQADTLVSALAAIPVRDGYYLGGIAAWVRNLLTQTLKLDSPLKEPALIERLAGLEAQSGRRHLTWEGDAYEVDLAKADVLRVGRLRKQQGEPSITTVLALDRIAASLGSAGLTLDDIRTITAELTSLSTALAPPKTVAGELPPGVDSLYDARAELKDVVGHLSGIRQTRDINRAAREVRHVLEVTDWVTGEALVSIAYAFELGDSKTASLSGQNVAIRHDFGLGESDGELQKRVAWTEPAEDLYPGRPWRVRGSVLGLDVGLAHLSLRRISPDPVRSPLLNENERRTFVRSVALIDPRGFSDASQAGIAAADQKGRARVAALSPDSVDDIAEEIGMDGWRRRAVQWALAHDGAAVASYFTMTELLRLGGGPEAEKLVGWGVAPPGSLRLQTPPRIEWWATTGREQLGVLSAQIPDLNLHVAATLGRLNLPAALIKAVLARAVLDYVDLVRPTDSSDWLTLVRTAQALPQQKIEDYVASLTSEGPLYPEESRNK